MGFNSKQKRYNLNSGFALPDLAGKEKMPDEINNRLGENRLDR